MKGGSRVNITKIRPRPVEWVTKSEAQEIAHCSHNTIDKIIKEMEALVNTRYHYPITAVGISNTKLIDRLALNDYIRNRSFLQNKIRCNPYDPKREAIALGYVDQEVRDVID